jgi:DNA processing protein
MAIDHILLHLSLIPHVGPATIERLVNALSVRQGPSDELLNIYRLNVRDIMHTTGISQATAVAIVQGLQDVSLLEQELMLIEQYKITWLTVHSAGYPPLLKTIYLPPTVVYMQGQPLADNHRIIAIVGSRTSDAYGRKAVNMLVPELVRHNWTIASGGAVGIDTAAHRAALDAGGRTIVVLGSGLLKPYPACNKDLFNRIAQGLGTIISPFALRVSPLAAHFPARNRIIAGLSKGCVVVQAAKPSGALITARYALEQGREVCAVPGAIDNPLSTGCHELISDGATLVTCAQDIRRVLQDDDLQVSKLSAQLPQTVQDRIIAWAARPIAFDDLLAMAGLSPECLQELLMQLQLDGSIEQNLMGLWQAV